MSEKEIIQKILHEGGPMGRLLLNHKFVSRDYSEDPLATAISTMLNDVLKVDFLNIPEHDTRKGAVARAMGLSSGWPDLKAHKREFILMVYDHQMTLDGMTNKQAYEKVAETLNWPSTDPLDKRFLVRPEDVRNAVKQRKRNRQNVE